MMMMVMLLMFRPDRDAAFSLKQLINKFSKTRAIKCSLHLHYVHHLIRALPGKALLTLPALSLMTTSQQMVMTKQSNLNQEGERGVSETWSQSRMRLGSECWTRRNKLTAHLIQIRSTVVISADDFASRTACSKRSSR
jgi:hypothetical protein